MWAVPMFCGIVILALELDVLRTMDTVAFTHYGHDKVSMYVTVTAASHNLALKCFLTDMYIMLCMNIYFVKSSESQSYCVKREI